MRNIILLFLIAILLSTNACDQTSKSSNDPTSSGPYSSNIENYPSDWEGRTFQCNTLGKQFDWIPGFTLSFYSNPDGSEFEELCRCIDENTKMPWVKDTGRKINNRKEITDFMHRRGFPTRFGEKIETCTKNK
jgi:hypothetical protein